MFNKTLQELVRNPEWSTAEVQTQRNWWDWDLAKHDDEDDKEKGSLLRERMREIHDRMVADPNHPVGGYGKPVDRSGPPNLGTHAKRAWEWGQEPAGFEFGVREGGKPFAGRIQEKKPSQPLRAEGLSDKWSRILEQMGEKARNALVRIPRREPASREGMSREQSETMDTLKMQKQEEEEWVKGKGFPSQEGIHPYNQKRQGYIHPSNRPDAPDQWRPQIAEYPPYNTRNQASHQKFIQDSKRIDALDDPYMESQSWMQHPEFGEYAAMQGRPGKGVYLGTNASPESSSALAEMSAQARRQRAGRGEFAGTGGMAQATQRQRDYMPHDAGRFGIDVNGKQGWEQGIDAWDPRTGSRGRMRPSHAEQLAAKNPDKWRRINPHLQKSNLDTFKQWMEEQS